MSDSDDLELRQDLTFGIDKRGDHALFIAEEHFRPDEWTFDDEVFHHTSTWGPTFFRVIDCAGFQQKGHGWLEKGKVVQWG